MTEIIFKFWLKENLGLAIFIYPIQIQNIGKNLAFYLTWFGNVRIKFSNFWYVSEFRRKYI